MQTAQRPSRLPDASKTVGLVVADTSVKGLIRASDQQYAGGVPVEWGLPRKTYFIPEGYAVIGCSDCNTAYALPNELVLHHRRVTVERVEGARVDADGFFYCLDH